MIVSEEFMIASCCSRFLTISSYVFLIIAISWNLCISFYDFLLYTIPGHVLLVVFISDYLLLLFMVEVFFCLGMSYDFVLLLFTISSYFSVFLYISVYF